MGLGSRDDMGLGGRDDKGLRGADRSSWVPVLFTENVKGRGAEPVSDRRMTGPPGFIKVMV